MENKMLKIWRFSYSIFGGIPSKINDGGLSDETITAEKVYDDKELSDIAASGFNAIWVHCLLHNIVSAEPFSELGHNSSLHLDAMQRLIDRAAKYGIQVFIYMQPPRALPVSWTEFWEKHSDIWGDEDTARSDLGDTINLRSMCISVPKVRNWLELSAVKLGQELQGLGGIILITASEFPAHCGRRIDTKCPRCSTREHEEIAAEVIMLIEKGIHSTSPDADVIAWNWSWGWSPDSQDKIIKRLPAKVILMADFERGGIKDIPGRKGHVIDEYSLSYDGPSERFMHAYKQAEERGLQMLAKLQLGTTHELASVVSLPLLGNIYEKADFIRRNNLSGFMGCWNFGNFTSANTVGFNYFLGDDRPPEKEAALKCFAASYLQGCDAGKVVDAWNIFQKAMDYFPFCIPFLYNGVQNFTLSFQSIFEPGPLKGGTSGRAWVKEKITRGDNLSGAITDIFPLDDIINRFAEVAKIWHTGTEVLKSALKYSDTINAKQEFGNAVICGTIWRSTCRAYRLYRLRQTWNESSEDEFQSIIKNELEDLKAVLPYVDADQRQGYHAEAGYRMFDGESIQLKISCLLKFLRS